MEEAATKIQGMFRSRQKRKGDKEEAKEAEKEEKTEAEPAPETK